MSKSPLAQALCDFAAMVDSIGVDMGPWNHLSCGEAETVAKVLYEAGYPAVAETLLDNHCVGDDEGDDHYARRLELEGMEGPRNGTTPERRGKRVSDKNMWDVGPGWFPIIEELERDLEEMVPGYRVVQVKEKFGGLRYYADPPLDAPEETWREMQKRIDAAETLALDTCEECGSTDGVTTESKPRRYWIKTLCPKCRQEEVSV